MGATDGIPSTTTIAAACLHQRVVLGVVEAAPGWSPCERVAHPPSVEHCVSHGEAPPCALPVPVLMRQSPPVVSVPCQLPGPFGAFIIAAHFG